MDLVLGVPVHSTMYTDMNLQWRWERVHANGDANEYMRFPIPGECPSPFAAFAFWLSTRINSPFPDHIKQLDVQHRVHDTN